ncbi:uL15 family ribosomal protein, partial [Candidatus Peregrinibacteria bacterium]|nr:uL15 family ribosomal protein [Candidatus Peregrinibacteria bacterium]
FGDSASVDLVAPYEHGLISRTTRPVKLLGQGNLAKKLTVKVDACSAQARKKIEEKGGSVHLPSPVASAAPSDAK